MPPLKMMSMLSPLGAGGAAMPAPAGARLGVEGNIAQLTLAKVFQNLAPNVPGLMGTDDEATPTKLYNSCAEPLLMPALRQLVEVPAGLDVIVEMAGGNVDNLAENVERAARALLGEILAARFGGEGDELEVCFYLPLHFKRILLTILTCPPHILTFKNSSRCRPTSS